MSKGSSGVPASEEPSGPLVWSDEVQDRTLTSVLLVTYDADGNVIDRKVLGPEQAVRYDLGGGTGLV